MGEENESVRGRRNPSSLFAVEIACVCSVFGVGNKYPGSGISNWRVVVKCKPRGRIESQEVVVQDEAIRMGDRGRGTGGRRGRPRKRTGVPLNLGDAEVGTSTPPATCTPVIPTPSLSEGLPAMRMIPTPGLRVHSFETPETHSQRQTPTQTTTGDDEPPTPEPDPMPWPPVDNPLPEGEEKEEELAR
ncbi:hypothetical protein PIB30_089550 [Stylosanthes scabra]|uniref:Uncharacterized protein n=1 Tax=Stylosanthes scabra TaxID=79078 RepID=A0ABU6WXK2_9FABA|nr:hypothetical protein [Stylosanthes scabra]